MATEVLQVLAGIHATFCGIIAAFVSAYALYAYEKIQVARDRLDSIAGQVTAAQPDTVFIKGGGTPPYLLPNGELDWRQVQRRIHTAGTIFMSLDTAAARPGESEEVRISEGQILEACEDLCTILYHVLTTHPFPGRAVAHIAGVSETVEPRKHKFREFDRHRLDELAIRLSFLTWVWNAFQASLMTLANRATEICKTGTDFQRTLLDNFGMIERWRAEWLPELVAARTTFDLYNQKFAVRKVAMNALMLVTSIVGLGVVLPLVLLLFADDGTEALWLRVCTAVLLLTTTAPYFFGLRRIYRAVKGLKFA